MSGLGRVRRNGFALVIVLNVIVILAGIAVVASEGSREGALVASNLRDDAERRALTDAVMAMAAARLSSDRTEARWFPDGRSYGITLFGTPVEVRVQDEGGKLSLNATDEAALAHAFANAGVGPGQAESIAAAIADWRDSDDDRRLGGAERADYAAAGLAGLPANAPFQNLNELHAVRGISNDVFREISPLLSAISDQASVNLDTAPKPVLEALFGANSPEVAAILARRAIFTTPGLTQNLAMGVSRSDGVSRQSGSPSETVISVDMSGRRDGRPFRYFGAFRLLQDERGVRMAVVEAPSPIDSAGIQ